MIVGPPHLEQNIELDGSPIADINVTPLVDVMLVLLIVFMVAAPMMVEGVPIDLPNSSGASLGRSAKPLVISLTRSGELYVRDAKVSENELAGRLRTIRASEGDLVIYVRADRGIAYGDVMDVIGRLGEAGIPHVSLLSQPGHAADTK